MSSGSLRDAYRAFTTTCALITTNGPRGPNVMAAEWTFNVSYEPFLIAVHVDPANATHDEILAAGEFGVNLASEEQIAGMGFAGHYSKVDTDKLSSEVFETYPARRIRAPMLKGCLLNAECRLVQHVRIGDHTMFIGEVQEFSVEPARSPIVLHHGSHRLGERIARIPGIILSATPSEVTPGAHIRVAGELTGTARDGQPVEVELRDPEGRRLASAASRTDSGGSFGTALKVPGTSAPGTYLVGARWEDLEGRARVRVTHIPGPSVATRPE